MNPGPCKTCLELAAYARGGEGRGLNLSAGLKTDDGRTALRLGVAHQVLQELALRIEAHAREHQPLGGGDQHDDNREC